MTTADDGLRVVRAQTVRRAEQQRQDPFHEAALATMTGEPVSGASGVKQVMDVILSLYSVVVFAAVAGAAGAFFLERRAEEQGAIQDPAVGRAIGSSHASATTER